MWFLFPSFRAIRSASSSPVLPPRPGWLLLLGIAVLPLGAPAAHAQPASVEGGLSYTVETMGVVAGGADRGLAALDNVDATATLRPEAMIGWSGLAVHVHGLGNQGGSPSALVGDAQGTSNIETPRSWHIYEAWVQQTGSRASVLVGLYDLNAEFDVNRTGGLFLHSSHGIGAAFGLSGRNGPSIFPVTSLGGRVRIRLANRGYVQAAVLDGVPGRPDPPGGTVVRLGGDDGVLAVAEGGVHLGGAPPNEALVNRLAEAESSGRLLVGGWIYSTPLPEWSSMNARGPVERSGGSKGLYGLAEGRLFREPGAEAQGLSGVARVGWAGDRHNRFAGYTGAGLVYTGAAPGRDDDQVGLAVATAYNGALYRAAQRRAGQPTTRAETDLELTYAAALRPWLTLTGDVQYVVNPNTDPTLQNALVGGLRLAVEL